MKDYDKKSNYNDIINLVSLYCEENNFVAAKKVVENLTDDNCIKDASSIIYEKCINKIKELLAKKKYSESEKLCLEFRENIYVESMLLTAYIRLEKLDEAQVICDKHKGNPVFDTRQPVLDKKIFKKIVKLIRCEEYEVAVKYCEKNTNDSGIMYLLAKIYYIQENFEKSKSILIEHQSDQRHQNLLCAVYKSYSVKIGKLIREHKYTEALKLAEINTENEIIKSQYVTILINKRRIDEAIAICNEFISNPIFSGQLGKIYNLIENIVEGLFDDNKFNEAYEMLIKYQYIDSLKDRFSSCYDYIGVQCLAKEISLLEKINTINNITEEIVNEILLKEEVEQLIYKGFYYKKCKMDYDLNNLKKEIYFKNVDEYFEIMNTLGYLLELDSIASVEDFENLLDDAKKIQSEKEVKKTKKKY